MQSSNENVSGNPSRWGWGILLLGVTVGLVAILLPFFGAIMWGGIIALMFTPLYSWLRSRLKLRNTLAALATMVFVLFIVILPLALIFASLAREASALYQRLQSGDLNAIIYFHTVFDALPQWILVLLDRFGLGDFGAAQAKIIDVLGRGSQYVATQAFSIGQNTFEFVASLFIAVYLAFFLIRDGESQLIKVGHAIPLAPAHKRELLETFKTVIGATVRGNLLVAGIQGALGGLAFWFLGLSGALLWGALMAFLSLVPAVGASLVWMPVAVYFLLSGALWQAVALIAFGVLVIGLVDNLLRPILVGKEAHMPDYIVMIATVGGIAAFGINGFVLGPAIAAMFITVWRIYAAQHYPTD